VIIMLAVREHGKEGDPYLRTLLVQGAHHILSSQALLKQFRIESSINVVLMDWIAISLEGRDQSCYPGGKNDQIAGIGSRRVGVGHPGWHKDCGSGADVFGSVGVAEGEFAV